MGQGRERPRRHPRPAGQADHPQRRQLVEPGGHRTTRRCSARTTWTWPSGRSPRCSPRPASSVAARYGMALVEGAGGAPSVFDTPSNQADHNVFDVSLPIADEMLPFVNWIASLPPRQRPKTAAYPMAQDPVRRPAGAAGPDDAAASSGSDGVLEHLPRGGRVLQGPGRPGGRRPGADLVVLGSTDVPTVQRLHAGVRAAALHAQDVHRGGRAGPGQRVHLRGRAPATPTG